MSASCVISDDVVETTAAGPIPTSNFSVTVYTEYMGLVCPPPNKSIDLTGGVASTGSFTYSLVSNGSMGTVTISGSTATYAPIQDKAGSDSFVYRVTGSDGATGDVTVSITIEGSDLTAATTGTTLNTHGNVEKSDAVTYTTTDTGKGITNVSVVYNPLEKKFYSFSDHRFSPGPCGGNAWAYSVMESLDGTTWVRSNGDVFVLSPTDVTNACSLHQPGMVFDGELYHIFTQATFNDGTRGLLYFTSTDLATFTYKTRITTYTPNPSQGFPRPVIYNNEIYLLESDTTTWPGTELHLVYSSNGKTTWTEQGQILTTATYPNWDTGAFATHRALGFSMFCSKRTGEKPFNLFLHMASTGTADDGYAGTLHSDDGITWTESTLLTPAGGALNRALYGGARILRHNNAFLIFWTETDSVDGARKSIWQGSTYGAWPSI